MGNASKGLVIVAGLGGVSEGLADVAVGPLVGRVAAVCGVGDGVGALRLGGAVLRVVEVEAVADVAEKPRGRLLFALRHAFAEPATRGDPDSHLMLSIRSLVSHFRQNMTALGKTAATV